MAESSQQSKSSKTQSMLPANVMQAQESNTALLMRANEIISETARAVWESEMEFFRQEADRIAKLSVPSKPDGDPTQAIAAYSEQWQDSSEKLLQRIRTVNDLMLKSSWDLFHLYRQGLQDAAKPFQTPPR